jgi:hypothetical protein
MKLTNGKRIGRAVLASAAALGAAVLLAPGTAAAAVNDNFAVSTTDGCGVVNFIDYGPGAPGGGDNDDYAVIHDYCADGHGIRAAVWFYGEFWGYKYNGNGQAGAAVIWDPFKDWGGSANLRAGDVVQLEVCLVDGPNDSTGARCRKAVHVMADG